MAFNGIELVCIGLIGFSVFQWTRRRYLKREFCRIIADQALLDEFISTFRTCPNLPWVIACELDLIRKRHGVVRMGHIYWILNKLDGRVERNALPPPY